MTAWTIFDYITTEGRNLIAEWCCSQDERVNSALDVTLILLRQTDDWTDPSIQQFREFWKSEAGLSEIRFHVDVPRPKAHPTRRRLRIIGLYRPTERQFIGLVGCEEHGMNYLPPDAMGEAMKQKGRFEQGLGWTHERI